MARKNIFLESSFWDSFLEYARSLKPDAEGCNPIDVFERITRWNELFKFICRSSVFIDSPLYTLAEKAKTSNDVFFQYMLQCSGDGLMDLDYQEPPFPDLESDERFEYEDDYSSLFFTAENHLKAARNHGVINICLDSIWDQQNKFVDSGDAVKTDRGWSWKKMDILKENSNSMVLIDNFLLAPLRKTRECFLRYDLRDLLKQMLPDYSYEEYVLSVFYYDDSNDLRLIDDRKEQYYSLIEKYVKQVKPKLLFSLELFPTISDAENHHKDFHDRTIITNNIWIGSEAGFDLLVKDTSTNTNTRAIKTTKIHGLYLGFGDKVAQWLEGSYDNLISEAKQCLVKYNYKSNNRLLR